MAPNAVRQRRVPAAREAELLERAQLGDKPAFTELFTPYRSDIVGVARTYGISVEDCQDLAQRVLYKVWRGLAGFRGQASLDTWLFIITRRCCLDMLSSLRNEQRRAQATWHQLMDAPSSDPVHVVMDRLDANAAAAAIDRDPRMKVIVTMLDAGYRVSEIAPMVHLSISSVHRLIDQARTIARAALTADQEEAS